MNENLQTKGNLNYDASVSEVRNSMLRWFAEAMGEDFTVEQWRTFKAHLYPNPVTPVPDYRGPDYEAMYEDRFGHGPLYYS